MKRCAIVHLQDLELDIPDAAHFVALFLGRATVDEVLPPAFLTAVLQQMHDDSLGVQVVRSVGESAQPSLAPADPCVRPVPD